MPHGFDIEDERPLTTGKSADDTLIRVAALAAGEDVSSSRRQTWKPITLRSTFLLPMIAVTLGLIALVQWMVLTSREHQGLLFASDINDLPFRASFMYLYFPTIISVLYSFLWTWVDLDVKRLEPFFQLSEPDGALAEDSILLHYPFDFLASVPLKAFKRKHWSVFATSVIMVLVFWGLTPIQAGIFAIRTITVKENIPMYQATSYIDIGQQSDSAIYAQSVYNIAWMNETLPPFMTKEYLLAAFGPDQILGAERPNLTYSGMSTLYSVDLDCDVSTRWNDSGVIRSNSSHGCTFGDPIYSVGNSDPAKPYRTLYAGHVDSDTNADYYLDDSCSDRFWVRWTKMTASAIAAEGQPSEMAPEDVNSTSLFCTPSYYQQVVDATVEAIGSKVLHYTSMSDKERIPANLFNATIFELAMSSGNFNMSVRTDYPVRGWPEQKARLMTMPLDSTYLPPMAPFAIAAYQRPMADYLNPETLRLSYQAAYRLLFARRLSDMLEPQLNLSTVHAGVQTYATQAVVIVPGFAYTVLTLLGAIACLGCFLLFHTLTRSNNLRQDPGSIAATMKLLLGSSRLTAVLSELDRGSAAFISKKLEGARLALTGHSYDEDGPRIKLLYEAPEQHARQGAIVERFTTRQGVRPTELRSAVGALFLGLQISALIAFAVIYHQASHHDGLSLPSQSTVVRQIVENYVPIAAATLMEPFWLVLNRLLCMLQPWEDLRHGNASAATSVGLNYNSLPPQFVLWKALKAKHVKLALICLMTILANGLAVALGGLMYEDMAVIATLASFRAQYQATLRPLNATGLPLNTKNESNWQGGTTLDSFYYKESNLTAGTALPPWTDETWAYLPVTLPTGNDSLSFQVSTAAIAASLECQPLPSQNTSYSLTFEDDAATAHLSVTLRMANGTTVQCTNQEIVSSQDAPYNLQIRNYDQRGRVALEPGVILTNAADAAADAFCRQHFFTGWLRAELQSPSPPRSAGLKNSNAAVDMLDRTETFMVCKPEVFVSPAEIVVSADGHVLRQALRPASKDTLLPNSADLISQAHLFLVSYEGIWHNDSFPSDFNNYLIDRSNVSLTNASAPVPSFDQAAPHVVSMYNQLFAILIGTNFDLLFLEAEIDASSKGSTLAPETRIFVSLPAFVVSEAILGLYILTTVWLYLRRPWRILPRLPTTIAFTAAYFAASNALQDMADQGDDAWRNWRWGYGSFVGVDGKGRTGIEREPLVVASLNRT